MTSILKKKRNILFGIILLVIGIVYCYYNTAENKSSRAKATVDRIILRNSYSADELYFLSEAYRHIGNEYMAFHFLQYAAQKGSDRAEYKLGMHYLRKEGNQASAITLLTRAADKGNPEYQYSLGFCYEYSFEREPEEGDYMKQMAAKYFLQAAEQGHPRAQACIAQCYRLGCGLEKNLEESEKWYMLAKKQGVDVDLGLIGLYMDTNRTEEALPIVYKLAEMGSVIAKELLYEILNEKKNTKTPHQN